MQPLFELTASEGAKAIADGVITSEALVTACLERIHQREDRIGAWQHLDPDNALAQARACDRSPSSGPLHGVPVGVKDIIDTYDMPTGYGSPIYTGHQPAWDAACVAMLRTAGAVILGKTVTTELAVYTPGKTANPHHTAHTPGGSSSGSAAAVADRMVPLALGSQTAGSIIRPAAFCGVVGYKPTHGHFPVAGIKALSQTLDTLGAFARQVDDLALLRAALLGGPARLPDPGPPPRIGLCRTPQWPHAAPEAREALETAAGHLKAAGAEVRDLDLPSDFDHLAAAQETVQTFEGARCCAYELTMCQERLSPKFIEVMAPGATLPYATYVDAMGLVATCRRQLAVMFTNHDALLVPSAPGEAPAGLAATGDPLFNRMWTLLHVPAVNLPGLTAPSGLPVGVQLIGPLGTDDRFLGIAAWAHAHLSPAT